MKKKTKYAIIGILSLAVIVIAFWPSGGVYTPPQPPGDWVFEITDEITDIWITDEMITCVGSSNSDAIFGGRITPSDASFIAFQLNTEGQLTSWTNQRYLRDFYQSLTTVRIDIPVSVSCSGGCTLTIPRCV